MLAFMLFAFVSSITPGPTNLLVLSTSARFGLRASIAPVFGACAGAALVVCLVGTSLGQTLLRVPGVQLGMTALGLAWLTWLAWGLFNAPGVIDTNSNGRRLGLWSAAALQWVNPKTWVMAVATVGVFTAGSSEPSRQVLHLSLLFFLIALPCMACWALLGAGSARWLRSERGLRWMNRTLAIVLFLSSWGALLRA
ncbi:LysE family translocator [Pseudomonas sp. KNUC1026]|uniref:LysE family translocator n=1 Tax=Pseudomonas sp. KNUC1026 TaxID=2893890 RepID=UPI001F1C879B|nr:LysE family translocator [Pseudomonas sp. KNUC1026]UFH49053.1 LysE family translocator [Pseudomonas sp. KNUC1026]